LTGAEFNAELASCNWLSAAPLESESGPAAHDYSLAVLFLRSPTMVWLRGRLSRIAGALAAALEPKLRDATDFW